MYSSYCDPSVDYVRGRNLDDTVSLRRPWVECTDRDGQSGLCGEEDTEITATLLTLPFEVGIVIVVFVILIIEVSSVVHIVPTPIPFVPPALTVPVPVR